MGQYHWPVNLDKKQFIEPHKLGCGLKLHDHGGRGGVNDAVAVLLACSSGRGGGDYQDDSPLIGSWAGDRIAIIGDYAEDDDIPGVNAREVFESLFPDEGESEYTDISDELVPVLEREFEFVFVGSGWMDRWFFDLIPGFSGSHGIGDRRICVSGKGEYLASELREAMKGYAETYHDGPLFRVKEIPIEKLNVQPVSQQPLL